MANLVVPCFRYGDKECNATLSIDSRVGPDVLIRCPIRQQLYRLTPEERVRQALIWFLREGSARAAVLGKYMRFGAEESSLDAAGFYAGGGLDDRFRPTITVVIFETKRLERDLLAEDVAQIRGYMLRERCRAGLLFNGRQAMWLSLRGDLAQPEWMTELLTDLREAEDRIERAALEADIHLKSCRETFSAANSGNFDALVQLVSLLGVDLSLTFVLSVRAGESISSTQAFGLRVADPNLVTFRTRGVVTRQRQQISRETFHSLVAVRPI